MARASAFSRQDFSISSWVCSTFTSSITIWETVQRKEMHLWVNESTAGHISNPIHHAGTVFLCSKEINTVLYDRDTHFRYKHQLGRHKPVLMVYSIVMFSTIIYLFIYTIFYTEGSVKSRCTEMIHKCYFLVFNLYFKWGNRFIRPEMGHIWI